ncbi:MAG: ornithine racemase Orr [Clostridiales bacterium]|nr:ornithine racemase Orr [Clostridiales bacterium]
MYPQIVVNLEKYRHNIKYLVEKCATFNIKNWIVTKSFCAHPEIVNGIVDCGIDAVADSRIQNLKKMRDLNIKKILLRVPMIDEVEDVVEYADYSLNSEIETIKKLGKYAVEKGINHKIIIMVDMGDLREGVWPDNVDEFIQEVLKIDGIEIKGFGTNLTCYGGVIPDENNLGRLAEISMDMAKKFSLDIEYISGGNSSSYYLVENNRIPKEINNLRLGEIALLGRETAFGNRVEGLYDDVFVLKAQIVELKNKPSVPIGTIGMDAFGNKPHYEDRGIIKRAIVAIGRQDINPDGLFPLDSDIDILGASSDHTILDVTRSKMDYKVGDIIEFKVDYGSLLKAMTSEYVEKRVI